MKVSPLVCILAAILFSLLIRESKASFDNISGLVSGLLEKKSLITWSTADPALRANLEASVSLLSPNQLSPSTVCTLAYGWYSPSSSSI